MGGILQPHQRGNDTPRSARLQLAGHLAVISAGRIEQEQGMAGRSRIEHHKGAASLRNNVREGMEHGDEAGGLSGAPVRDKSTHTVKVLAAELAGRLPIIAVGGITEGKHAAEKIAAGASLVQLYSGFIYKGPALIRQSVDAIVALPKA